MGSDRPYSQHKFCEMEFLSLVYLCVIYILGTSLIPLNQAVGKTSVCLRARIVISVMLWLIHPKQGSLKYNALVRNYKEPWASPSCDMWLLHPAHYTPDCPAWGLLTGLYLKPLTDLKEAAC